MMDLWLFSGTKLRTKFDTIRHCEERSDVAIHLSPFHNTCPLIQYRAIIKKGNAQTFGHLHVFVYCPIRTQDRYSVSDWGGHFFSLLLIKVRKNCNNSADNCCCTCNNSNKPVNIHCKASSYSNSGNPVECGRQPPVQAFPINQLYHQLYFMYSKQIAILLFKLLLRTYFALSLHVRTLKINQHFYDLIH